jgi:hypothetical protein
MMRLLSTLTGAVALLAMTGTAAAQDVLIQGPGVKVGESTVLRPRVGVEGGVVSNLFYEEDGGVSTGVLRLLAALDITPAGEDRLGNDEAAAPKIDFLAGLNLQYSEYVSSNERARAQRDLDVNALAGVTFNPRGTLAFALRDEFTRATRPTNFESSKDLDRDINHFEAEALYHPGGRMITISARYENTIDLFESLDFADRIQHLVGVRGNWKFFPYSQTWLDASLGFFGPLGANELAGMAYKVSSNPLRIVAGLDTLLTELVTIKAYVGYANGFYDEGPSYSTVVGGIEGGWRYVPFGRVVAGYSYDVSDSINANFFKEHHLRLALNQQIRTIFLTAGLGARFRSYEGIPMAVGGSAETRNDFILEARLRAAYIMRDRFSFYADYSVGSDQTDFRSTVDGQIDDPSYVRHEFVVGASAAF